MPKSDSHSCVRSLTIIGYLMETINLLALRLTLNLTSRLKELMGSDERIRIAIIAIGGGEMSNASIVNLALGPRLGSEIGNGSAGRASFLQAGCTFFRVEHLNFEVWAMSLLAAWVGVYM